MAADDGMTVPYQLKNGKTGSFNIDRSATFPFGFSFQDRVKTPRGLANVIGVRDGELWFHVDGDPGATFWSSCRGEVDFITRGFEKATENHPPVDPNEYHKLKTVTIYTPDNSEALPTGTAALVGSPTPSARASREPSPATTTAAAATAGEPDAAGAAQGDEAPPSAAATGPAAAGPELNEGWPTALAGAAPPTAGAGAGATGGASGRNTVDCLLVMQNINGPCPIIALANALLLSGKLQLPEYVAKTFISSQKLKEEILKYMCGLSNDSCPSFECPKELEGREVLSGMVERTCDTMRLAINTSEEEGLGMLSRFYEGLNVTPTFSHVDAFEAEMDVCLFCLAGLRVVHGWLIPEHDEEFAPLRTKPYIEVAALGMDDTAANSSAASKFLDLNRSQLTQWGVEHLKEQLKEGEVTVFFHNNHFSTLLKLRGKLLVVVSDEGYTDRKFVVFEELTVSGNGGFYDGAGEPVPEWLLGIISQYGDHFSTAEIEKSVSTLKAEGKEVTTALVVEILEKEKKNKETTSPSMPALIPAASTTTQGAGHSQAGGSGSGSGANAGSASTGGGLTAAEASDEKFMQLMSMGFEVDRIRAALLTTNGSVERSLDILFS